MCICDDDFFGTERGDCQPNLQENLDMNAVPPKVVPPLQGRVVWRDCVNATIPCLCTINREKFA